MTKIKARLTRRNLIKIAGAGIAAPWLWTGERAFGADEITAADFGGATNAAIKKAFGEPFEKEFGIRVNHVPHDTDPTVQFRLLVDTRSYIWDLCMVTPADVENLTNKKNYLEPLNIPTSLTENLMEGASTPVWAGFSVYSTIMAYRTDKFGDAPPQTWADFWDVKKFPGRRALNRSAPGPIEQALMADGVDAKKLYPLDIDRAFRKLEEIKPHINVWWTGGAQVTQMLQSGEIDMTDSWTSRAFAAILSGAPVRVSWKQGLYSLDGWSIPKGTPRLDLARKFVSYCLDPQRQAAYSNSVANGPTNPLAYNYITPERSQMLGTYPANLAGLQRSDQVWWGTNRSKVQERFNDFLLS